MSKGGERTVGRPVSTVLPPSSFQGERTVPVWRTDAQLKCRVWSPSVRPGREGRFEQGPISSPPPLTVPLPPPAKPYRSPPIDPSELSG